jgi:hypothetical protein
VISTAWNVEPAPTLGKVTARDFGPEFAEGGIMIHAP